MADAGTIVLDGSAMFAILLDEPEASACTAALAQAETVLLSAGSLTELLIVAARKGVAEEAEAFLAAVQPTIVPLTADRAYAAHAAYLRWGKGFHPARLNFADSFAYALAMEIGCPLLFVGNDFARTDVAGALSTYGSREVASSSSRAKISSSNL